MEPVTSTEATTCSSSNQLFAPATDSSGRSFMISQSIFSSTETHTDNHNAHVLLPPHYSDNKETAGIFGKPSCFPETALFAGPATSIQLPETARAMSSGTYSLMPEVPVISVKLPEKSYVGSTQISPVNTCPSSATFGLPKESVSNLFQSSKPPIPKLPEKTGFSFAETFRKETEGKSAFAEPQPEPQSIGIFGKWPAFSFSSAAANITTNKAFDCGMFSETVDHSASKGPSSGSNSQVCEDYSDKEESHEPVAVQKKSTTTSLVCHAKDRADASERKAKHKQDSSTPRSRKKVKDDEIKVDQKGSKLISPEELHRITSVVCKGIHPDLNNKKVLHKHFSKFGQIEKISCSGKYNQAVIVFSSHEAAKKAKMRGGGISTDMNKPCEIFWADKSPKSTGEKKSTSALVLEVKEELQSMMEIVEHAVLDRPSAPQSSKLPRKKSASPLKRTEKPKAELKDSKRSEKSIKSSRSIASNEESLKKILDVAALTEEDKYSVLDARDKLIRLNQKKMSHVSRTKAIVGTCPDICSEKERYSRFEKNCLSVYEQKKTFDPAVSFKCLDHRLIVKEYSRSSADKEEPLPHEVRPTHVLNLTMDHLMCNVANRATDSSGFVGEWYDFIWNRTRAIRKDITQQDLCNIDCVKLVEKCVRFHIHCAAALCEEDISVFDPKINDENLTKSLQTLKHMYHDLALNGIKCPNEAEFRAFDILLSLNEGDTLRQAQNFSSEIRDSREVRFAVSAALAMNSNNYIRFFKLVEEASYLSACIMHRYFTPVRVRALQVMLKAYCLPNHIESYPLQELVNILKFENTAEASQFCQWLKFQTDENYVQLDRMSIVTPSSSCFLTRSINLVEKKRCGISVGEVMNKGPLPVNPLISYEPHCSFDSDGYLKKEAYDALDQKAKAEKVDKIVVLLHCEPAIQKQSSVIRVTKLDTKKSETPIDSSLKQTVPSDFSTAVSDGQLGNCSVSVLNEDKVICLDDDDDVVVISQDTDDIVFKAVQPLIEVPAIEEFRSLFSSSDSDNLGRHEAGEQPCKTDEQPCKMDEGSPSLRAAVDVTLYASHLWEQLSSEVLQDCVHEIVVDEIALIKAETICLELKDSFVKDVVKDLCLEVSHDVLSEVMQAEMEQKKECASALAEEILHETVQEHVSSTVKHEYAEARRKMLSIICSSFMTSILDACVDDMVLSLCNEVYSEEMKNWKTSIQTAKRRTQLQQARKALVRWQRAYIRRRKLEICRDTFPSSPQIPLKNNSVNTEFGSVLSGVKKEKELSKLLDAGVLLSSIKQEVSWLPLDLSVLFEKHFPKLETIFSPDPKVVCWKLLILVPERCCSEYDDPDWILFIHWLSAKFCKEKCKSLFQDGMILCNLFSKDYHGYHINICVRLILLGSSNYSSNLGVMKKKRLLEGTSAILLLIPFHERHEETFVQVQEVLNTKCPFPAVPLYCFLVGTDVSVVPSTLIEFLNSLRKSYFVSDHKISLIKDTTEYWESSEKLLEAVAWLLNCYNKIPKLKCCTLKNFVEDCFLKIFGVMFENFTYRSPRQIQNVSKIINFYNSSLDDCIEIVCSSSLSRISWPPPELIMHEHVPDIAEDWNEPNNLNLIRSSMAAVHLPEFQGNTAKLEDMWIYAEEVTNIGSCNSSNFFSSIKSLLMKTEQTVHNNNFIPWCDVLYYCALYLASCQSFVHEFTEKEIKVTYVFEDMNYLDLTSKWETVVGKESKTVFSDQNSVSVKRKYSSDEPSEPGSPCKSDVPLEAPAKFARSDQGDKNNVKAKLFDEQTYQQHISFSLNKFTKCVAEEDALHLMEALDAEKCQSESYISALEAKVAEGQEIQWNDESTLDDTFLEEYCEEAVACSPEPYVRSSDDVSLDIYSKSFFSPLDLYQNVETFGKNIKAQENANKSFERGLRQLCE